MARRKPPPRTLEPHEERKQQRFLERAAPIVLENPVLDAERLGALKRLAHELELSDEQLRDILKDLRERGVVKRIESGPPKPPPLPRADGTRAAPRPPANDTPGAGFSLTPPPPPPRGTARPKRRSKPPTPPEAQPKPRPEPSPPVPQQSPDNRAEFLSKAAAIIARHRGTTPQARVLLAMAAREHGLSDEEAAEVLRSIQREKEPTPTPDERGETAQPRRSKPKESDVLPARRSGEPPINKETSETRKRWRIEGEPEPEPPPPPQDPAEVYREYLRQSLSQAGEKTISVDFERSLVVHGLHVLGLSQVYASHLLQEVAGDLKLPLESEASEKAKGEASEKADDARLRAFLQSIAPILTEHRGINAKSRVLMNALAREQGLSDKEMERALASLQSREEGTDLLQRERQDAFREHVRLTLTKVPHGVVTANLVDHLAQSGAQLYGVAEDQVRPIIHEVAGELNLAVVSHERAEQHLQSLVTDLLGDAVRINREMNERIHAEGAQWGLASERIDQIIRERSQANFRRQRSERNITGLALAAASIAVLFVVLFLSWTVLESQLIPKLDSKSRVKSNVVVVPPKPRPDVDDSWWDADLAVAAANARVELPLLGRPLRDLKSARAEIRGAAYTELISHMFDDEAEELQRELLAQVLSRCCALDPSEKNADRIMSALLERIPAPGTQLSEDEDVYPKMFAALRAAVSATVVSREEGTRSTRLADALGHAVGTAVDLELGPRAVERLCLGALAERLFRSLISTAATQPHSMAALHAAIATQAARYLEAAMVDKLNADFLVALLSSAVDLWKTNQELIRQTIDSPDPLAVVKLLELFERTADAELQEFMSGPLLLRAGAFAESRSVTEIADEVRRSLGVGDEMSTDDRWAWLSRSANQALAGTAMSAEPDAEMLQEIVDLAHYATLACAFAQDEMGSSTFDTMRKDGPPVLAEAMSERGETGYRTSRGGGVSFDKIQRAVDTATNGRRGLSTRVGGLESLARMSTDIPDILPSQAETLATYLLSSKNDQEHERVLRIIRQMTRWKHLRLALADGLDKDKVTLQREQLQQLLSEALDTPLELGDGNAGREAARAALLQAVLGELNRAAGGSVSALQPYDRTRRALYRFYATQAQMLSVAVPEDAEHERPSQVLSPLIEAYAMQLKAKSSEEISRELEALPHELTAANYAAADDLQLTVLLERLWIRVLAQAVSQRFPHRTTLVNAVLQELQAADQRSAHVVPQLRDAQVALVRLWLLWNQPA